MWGLQGADWHPPTCPPDPRHLRCGLIWNMVLTDVTELRRDWPGFRAGPESEGCPHGPADAVASVWPPGLGGNGPLLAEATTCGSLPRQAQEQDGRHPDLVQGELGTDAPLGLSLKAQTAGSRRQVGRRHRWDLWVARGGASPYPHDRCISKCLPHGNVKASGCRRDGRAGARYQTAF